MIQTPLPARVSPHPDAQDNAAAVRVLRQTRVRAYSSTQTPWNEDADVKQSGTRVAAASDMPAHLQIVTDTDVAAPKSEDPALRPTKFDDYVGQAELINNLRQSVEAAKRGGWQLDHMLFAGPAGLGKTSLAGVIAAELGGKLYATSAPAIEHKGALATLLTTLKEGDLLFIDEIHALDRAIAECLYTAMEDRVIDLAAGKRVIRVQLPRFTLLAATTHAGKLPRPLLDRFGFVWQLRPYTTEEMAAIVVRSAGKLGVVIDAEAATAVARASRGTPRLGNRLLRRVRDVAVHGAADPTRVTIDGTCAQAALTQLGIDALGLDVLDRRYLAVVAERSVGIEALCAELAEDRSTIEDAVEPFLVQAGLVKRGSKGRCATDAGRAHLDTQETQ